MTRIDRAARLAALRARAAANPDDARWVGYSEQEQAELEAYAELAEVSAQWAKLAERERLRSEVDRCVDLIEPGPDTQRTPPSAPLSSRDADPIPLVTVRRPTARTAPSSRRARRGAERGSRAEASRENQWQGAGVGCDDGMAGSVRGQCRVATSSSRTGRHLSTAGDCSSTESHGKNSPMREAYQ